MKGKMGVGLVLLLLAFALPALAQFHSEALYGTASACGALATGGTITASSSGFSDSISINADGTFGGAGVNDDKLLAQTNSSTGQYSLAASSIPGCSSVSTINRTMSSGAITSLSLDFGGSNNSGGGGGSGSGSGGGGGAGGSSAGGGGAGAATDPNVVGKKAAFWSSIENGETVTMAVDLPQIAIGSIRITFAEGGENIAITVKAFDSRPGGLERAPTDTVYQYLQIELTNADASQISKADIDFKVRNDWLEEHNAESDRVRLFRMTQQWDQLPTDQESTDSIYNYFTAHSPGLSYFAVGLVAGSSTAPPEITPSQPTSTQPEETTPEPTVEQKERNKMIWVVALLVIVVIALIAYVVMSKKKTV